MKVISKVRKVTGNIFKWLIGLLILFSSMGAIFGLGEFNEEYVKLGISEYQLLIGIGKLVIALLILIPQTFIIGILAHSAFWGGTIVTHMIHGDSFVFQSLMLALVWTTYFLLTPNPLRR